MIGSSIIGGEGEKAAAIRGQPSASTDISQEDPHVGIIPEVKAFQLMRLGVLDVMLLIFVYCGALIILGL